MPHISCTTNTLWTYALQVAFLEVRTEEKPHFVMTSLRVDTSLSFICSMSTRIAISGTRPFWFGWTEEKVSSNSFWQAFGRVKAFFRPHLFQIFGFISSWFLLFVAYHSALCVWERQIRDCWTSHLLIVFVLYRLHVVYGVKTEIRLNVSNRTDSPLPGFLSQLKQYCFTVQNGRETYVRQWLSII